MSVFRDLRLLLWKNYILQKRHPFVAMSEIVIPCLFAVMLAVIRIHVVIIKSPNATVYDSFDTKHIPDFTFLNITFPKRVIIYSPNSSQVNTFMTRVTSRLKGFNDPGFIDKFKG